MAKSVKKRLEKTRKNRRNVITRFKIVQKNIEVIKKLKQELQLT